MLVFQTMYLLQAAVFDVRAPSPPHKKPVDMRETLEYKKALELQLWMEEQQALYKAQVFTSNFVLYQ